LTLSIRAPRNPTGKSLPVYIFLYGGAFEGGGTDVPFQVPQPWIQRTQSHVVIAVNYRVNTFGFPNAAGLEDQNLGFLDQRLGIEWTRDNVAKFGGDPEKMILWGQSAGAGSVDYQNFAFPDDPIVSGFVSDSGSVYAGLVSVDYNHSSFSAVAEHFNCFTSDPAVELSCMRKVPQTDIENFTGFYSQSSPINFFPIPDEKLVFSNYTERYEEGLVSKKPANLVPMPRMEFRLSHFLLTQLLKLQTLQPQKRLLWEDSNVQQL
jgi:carboxylesterase type B